MPDIQTRADLENLVNHFYEKVRQEPELGPIFNEIVNVDWASHLPKMVNFWENILFQTGAYKGGMMYTHLQVNALMPLRPELFERWLVLFFRSVDELFVGPRAEAAKAQALRVAEVMNAKIGYLNRERVG
ncbi:MAG: group III truncated hemoglobin [Cytophagaceae bacterium]|nr:group III truncated hemoglobin [Cytophagaceae bacterium]